MRTKNPLAPILGDKTTGSLGLSLLTAAAGFVAILCFGYQLPLLWKLVILLLAATTGAIVGQLKPYWGIWCVSLWIRRTAWLDRLNVDNDMDYHDEVIYWQRYGDD